VYINILYVFTHYIYIYIIYTHLYQILNQYHSCIYLNIYQCIILNPHISRIGNIPYITLSISIPPNLDAQWCTSTIIRFVVLFSTQILRLACVWRSSVSRSLLRWPPQLARQNSKLSKVYTATLPKGYSPNTQLKRRPRKPKKALKIIKLDSKWYVNLCISIDTSTHWYKLNPAM